MGFHSHEPATAAFPQCQLRSRRAAPPPGRSTTTRPKIDTAPSDSNDITLPERIDPAAPMSAGSRGPVLRNILWRIEVRPAAQEKNLSRPSSARSTRMRNIPGGAGTASRGHGRGGQIGATARAASANAAGVRPARRDTAVDRWPAQRFSSSANDDDVAKSVLMSCRR